MQSLSGRSALAGLVAAASLTLCAGAHAKCMPATERPLPRPTTKTFVAVLVTCDTRVDALKVFADLSTKNPSVLASTTLDVDEINVGAKGTYYRALLGKPGAKKEAAGTCTTLKAAGYKWCRAMQF
jgi:hypothetical protein